MSKKQLENKYNILIEEKDNVLFVFRKSARDKILLFLAPNLSAIDKSMQFMIKAEI